MGVLAFGFLSPAFQAPMSEVGPICQYINQYLGPTCQYKTKPYTPLTRGHVMMLSCGSCSCMVVFGLCLVWGQPASHPVAPTRKYIPRHIIDATTIRQSLFGPNHTLSSCFEDSWDEREMECQCQFLCGVRVRAATTRIFFLVLAMSRTRKMMMH